MNDREEPETSYPHGRGYGHDYMRGGEVLGGYGYSQREEYEKPAGELHPQQSAAVESTESARPGDSVQT